MFFPIGECEGDTVCMECESFEAKAVFMKHILGCIEHICDNRPPYRTQMHTNLVGSTSLGSDF